MNNNFCSVDHEAVSDAFNIGGRFSKVNGKRDGLVERDACPAAFDFSSMMHPTVDWDPDSILHAVDMCTDLNSGTGKV